MGKSKINTDISIITFRIDKEEFLVFKKHQFLLKIKEGMNVQESFSYLLERAKKKLEKENNYFNSDENPEFLERLTSAGKKNLKIRDPKKIQMNISPQTKKTLQNVAYSFVKRNNEQDFSYYYVFKNILKLNEDLV